MLSKDDVNITIQSNKNNIYYTYEGNDTIFKLQKRKITRKYKKLKEYNIENIDKVLDEDSNIYNIDEENGFIILNKKNNKYYKLSKNLDKLISKDSYVNYEKEDDYIKLYDEDQNLFFDVYFKSSEKILNDIDAIQKFDNTYLVNDKYDDKHVYDKNLNEFTSMKNFINYLDFYITSSELEILIDDDISYDKKASVLVDSYNDDRKKYHYLVLLIKMDEKTLYFYNATDNEIIEKYNIIDDNGITKFSKKEQPEEEPEEEPKEQPEEEPEEELKEEPEGELKDEPEEKLKEEPEEEKITNTSKIINNIIDNDDEKLFKDESGIVDRIKNY